MGRVAVVGLDCLHAFCGAQGGDGARHGNIFGKRQFEQGALARDHPASRNPRRNGQLCGSSGGVAELRAVQGDQHHAGAVAFQRIGSLCDGGLVGGGGARGWFGSKCFYGEGGNAQRTRKRTDKQQRSQAHRP
ncbi:MAG TPA: hypothetical protein DCP91_03290 [Eggerthellaceae bacterium]|nr:hypothetical protein [Eggerthellaceae bacterium]